MRCLNRAALVVGAVAATVALAGCGATNGTLLSPEAATQLTSELNQASSALAAYNCLPAAAALSSFRDDVAQLTGVNATLVRMLSAGASRISALVDARCPTGLSAETTTPAASSTTTTTAAQTTTSASVTTTSPVITTTASQTNPGTGGAPPTTASTPPVPTSVPSTSTAPVTTPDSGGAGLDGSGGSSGTGGGGAP